MSGKCRIAMDQEWQNLTAIDPLVLTGSKRPLPGTRLALNDRIDRFQLARIRRQQNRDLIPRFDLRSLPPEPVVVDDARLRDALS